MNIGIIGCGNMGSGMAKRLAQKYKLYMYDHHLPKTQALAHAIQSVACSNLDEMIPHVHLIFLAVKPKDLMDVSKELAPKLSPKHLLASNLTGVSVQTLKGIFGNVPVVRIMPNLAVIYGKGVIGISDAKHLDTTAKMEIEEVCSYMGLIKWIPESLMDALTSLTGAGPALVLVMIESMVDAAIAMGFSAAEGKALVVQMLSGTLTMLTESSQHPGDVRWQIASPGGITIAGLRKMEETGVRSGVIEGFLSAYERAKQMSLSYQGKLS